MENNSGDDAGGGGISPVERDLVKLFTALGFLMVALTALLDCYRPGRMIPGYKVNRSCCGVIILRGLVVPLTLVVVLGMLVWAFANQENICTTPLGYCATISCVCGNIIWQGYVFMFITLTMVPVLVILGVVRSARKQLCCRLGCKELQPECCGQYTPMASNTWRLLHPFDGCIVWFYITGIACMALTGMMPALQEGKGVSSDIVDLAFAGHLFGVFAGVVLPLFSALLISFQRCGLVVRIERQRQKQKQVCKNESDKIEQSQKEECHDDDLASQKTAKASTASERDARHGSCNQCCLEPSQICFSQLGTCNHLALAALGYFLLIPLVVVAVGVFGHFYLQVEQPTIRADLCIVNDREIDCLAGRGCSWNSTFGSCENHNCSAAGAVSTAAEYFVLMLGFTNALIMMPAIVDLVDGAWQRRSEDLPAPPGTVREQDGETGVAANDEAPNTGAKKDLSAQEVEMVEVETKT